MVGHIFGHYMVVFLNTINSSNRRKIDSLNFSEIKLRI